MSELVGRSDVPALRARFRDVGSRVRVPVRRGAAVAAAAAFLFAYGRAAAGFGFDLPWTHWALAVSVFLMSVSIRMSDGADFSGVSGTVVWLVFTFGVLAACAGFLTFSYTAFQAGHVSHSAAAGVAAVGSARMFTYFVGQL